MESLLKSIKYFIHAIYSLFVFGAFIIANRLIFLIENKDFVLNQHNATSKWFELSNPLVNFVTFLPLVAAFLFFLLGAHVFALEIQRKS